MKEKKFASIESYLSTLDEERQNREDIVVPVHDIGMTDGQLVIDGESHSLSTMAKNQIAMRLGVTSVYWDRMVKFKQFDLLDTNVNRWISLHDEDDKYLISRKDKEVIAFLSPKYKIVDNYETLTTYMNSYKEAHPNSAYRMGGFIEGTGIGYVQMYETENVKEFLQKDPYSVGSVFKFSDVGGGISIGNLVYRQICSNGMMGFKEDKTDRIRLNGHSKDSRDYRNDPVYIEELPRVLGLTRALGRKSAMNASTQQRLNNLVELKAKKIDDLEAIIYTIKPYLKLEDDAFTAFMEEVIADKVDNYYDLVQAITKNAQLQDASIQFKMEQVGGWITDNSGKILDHIIINSVKTREKLDKKAKEEE